MENLSCSCCWLLHRHIYENPVKWQSEMYANIRWKDEDKRNWNFGKFVTMATYIGAFKLNTRQIYNKRCVAKPFKNSNYLLYVQYRPLYNVVVPCKTLVSGLCQACNTDRNICWKIVSLDASKGTANFHRI